MRARDVLRTIQADAIVAGQVACKLAGLALVFGGVTGALACFF